MNCNYDCGQEAKYQFKNGKYCCSKSKNSCMRMKDLNKKARTGKGIGIKPSDKCIEINRKRLLSGGAEYMNSFSRNEERLLKCREDSRKRMLNGLSEHLNSIPRNKEKIEKMIQNKKEYMKSDLNPAKRSEVKEKLKNRMLAGGAIIALKGVKNPSKPELMLRSIIKDLYPSSEHTFKVFNYAIDIAIPEYKIAIEYDGYHHFKDKEAIEYFKKRRLKIENEGWKFLRYTIFDKFPIEERVKKDITEIINVE